MRPRIICLGEGMVEEHVAPDGTLTTHYGGDTLNTAIHLARLGCDVGFATAVGDDATSEALVAAWQAEGLDVSLVMRHPVRTVGRYRIAIDDTGERSFSYYRSASAARQMFALHDFGELAEEIERAGCILFSLISLAILPNEGRRSLLKLASGARANYVKVAYDGNFRPALWDSNRAARLWHAEAIKIASIGLPTLEDEVAIGGAQQVSDAEEVAAQWTGLGCEEVLVKAGAAGCLLPEGTMLAPPAKLAPVDTSGAGDAFNAGYLAARLAGHDPHAAALSGHRVAGWNIMRPGAIPPQEDDAPYSAQ